MVEESKKTTYSEQILKAGGVFNNLMKMFNKRELINLREVSDKFAKEAPKHFDTIRYQCSYEEVKDQGEQSFMRLVTRPTKLELIDINGTEDHLRQVTQIVENITSTVEYVYLKFANYEDGVDRNCTDDLARQYMELFKDKQAFKNIRTLKIEIFGNGNFATMFDEMNKQKAHIAMF